MGSGSIWSDLLPITFLAVTLYLLIRAQGFWFVRGWRLTGRVRIAVLRIALRGVWFMALAAVVWPVVQWMIGVPRQRYPVALVGAWLAAAMFSWMGVQAVAGIERLWNWFRARFAAVRARLAPPKRAQQAAPLQTRADLAYERLANPSRRYLFQATALAVGVTPFAVSLFGYKERLRLVVEGVEVPIPDLPEALDGMRIAQLSDIHVGAYLPLDQVRRAVEMANELAADMAVVTGDLLTVGGDPLEGCVEELAALRAPLGVWGCNGNHEIYTNAELRAQRLFRAAGMRLLRQENAEVAHRGQPFNLIGVDYQRTRAIDGPRRPMLEGVEPLVRRGAFNILLSHNPNAFPRAAQLGIALTLAGHTHGGQVQVEILDHSLSPARFMTDFVSGLFHRKVAGGQWPVASTPDAAGVETASANSHLRPPATAFLYVNRGIGTVGTPIRVGARPEITLLTLRRA